MHAKDLQEYRTDFFLMQSQKIGLALFVNCTSLPSVYISVILPILSIFFSMVKKLSTADLLDHMYKLFNELDAKWTYRFEMFEAKMEKQLSKMATKEEMNRRFNQVDERFDKVEYAFERLYVNRGKDMERIERLEDAVGIS